MDITLIFNITKPSFCNAIRASFVVLILLSVLGCSSYEYPSRVELGKPLPSFKGNSLSGEKYTFPDDLSGEGAILLFGYVQDAQFDIDRWLIGFDMRSVKSRVIEVPTIKGLFPRLLSSKIDEGMRGGIPKELWSIVVTVYEDGDNVQRYTGNIKPNNARVMAIDKSGDVVYFYDRGFSVAALNDVIRALER